MDDIFLTVSFHRDPPTVYALVREDHNPNGPVRLCEIGSRMVAEHFETLPYGGSEDDARSYRCARRKEFMQRAKALAGLLSSQLLWEN